MKVTIRLPAALRRLAGDQEQVEADASTVGEAIKMLCERHPPLRDRLLKPSGVMKPSITVFVNNLPPAAKAGNTLKDGDTLVVVQPIGGG
jgi:molybdopterin converting factor small subunit